MVAKTAKSTKSVAPAKKETKAPAVRLTEDEKKADRVNYIFNPGSNKHVKRDSPLGKKLVKAEETGEEVAKTMTETERLILVVQTLQDQLGLEDSAIKVALTEVKDELPRSFPSAWGGKQKTARSPDHPKQSSNPYIWFTKAVRKSVVEANPDAKNTEIVSIMAKMWKETAEEDRSEYVEAAQKDKERYEQEMKVFEAEHPDQARAKNSPGSGKPTKETAYRLFSEEHREAVTEENPDLDGKQITKLLAEKWEELKTSDKAKFAEYQEAAKQANEGFEERVAEFNKSPGSSSKLTKAEQAKADDPEHYELKLDTGRYNLKEGWKKNPDGSFSKTGSPKKAAASPKVAKAEPKSVAKPVSKPVIQKKKVSEPVVEAGEDDEFLT